MLLLSRWLTPVPGFLAAGARVGFVPTASSIYPDQAWVDLDRATLTEQGFTLVELPIESMSGPQVAAALRRVDAVFVSGGNVFHLLAALRATGADDALADAVRGGLPYVGVSAGAAITGPDIGPLALLDDPAQAAPLSSTAALGLIDVTVVPHAEGTVTGRAVIDEMRARFADRRLLFLPDDEALLVRGDQRRIIAG